MRPETYGDVSLQTLQNPPLPPHKDTIRKVIDVRFLIEKGYNHANEATTATGYTDIHQNRNVRFSTDLARYVGVNVSRT